MKRLRWPALAALLLLGYLGSGQVVPLYDGIGFPDQPYRYVRVPAGVTKHGPPARTTHSTSPALSGTNSEELAIRTAEQGPQLFLDLPPSSTQIPVAANNVTLTATPLAPDTQPADGTIDGNIYRISVASDAGSGAFGPNVGQNLLFMRAASLKPAPPVMEYRPTPASAWTPVHTTAGGADVFVISFKGAGDFALVHRRGAKPVRGGPSQQNFLLLLLGGFIALAIVALLLVRRSVSQQEREQTG